MMMMIMDLIKIMLRISLHSASKHINMIRNINTIKSWGMFPVKVILRHA